MTLSTEVCFTFVDFVLKPLRVLHTVMDGDTTDSRRLYILVESKADIEALWSLYVQEWT